MLLLESLTQNPFFNIATEEYLLRHLNEDVLFSYINSPSVIIGKHQIAYREVDFAYLQKQQIPIVRRISGGGSVFHDRGNLNFCLISSQGKGLVDFDSFTAPLIAYLQELGVTAQLRSNSDIRIKGKKISGNASHIFKKTSMHHGSILFDTDLNALNACLKTNPLKYNTRSVASRRSVVTNISTHLKHNLPMEIFRKGLTEKITQTFALSPYTLSAYDIENIQNLIQEKYAQDNWNLGYNAQYQFHNSFMDKNGLVTEISFDVKKGFASNFRKNNQELFATTQLGKELEKFVPHETFSFLSHLKDHFTEEEIRNYFF